MAEAIDWGIVGSTVVTGLVVVFLILAILVFFLWVFGKIFKAINKSKEKKKAEQLAVLNKEKPQTVSPAPTGPSPDNNPDDDYEDEDDDEIIAVIAAAIAAYGEAEGKQYRIAGIKRPKKVRPGWSSAGIADNMRGFTD